MDAGDTGRYQQLSEAFFTGSRTQGHTVEQDLIPGCSEQQSTSTTFVERSSKFLPGCFKIWGSGTHMAKLV